MTVDTVLVPILVDSTKRRDPLNWCPTCRKRDCCVTIVVNPPGLHQGPLLPLIAVACCSQYDEDPDAPGPSARD